MPVGHYQTRHRLEYTQCSRSKSTISFRLSPKRHTRNGNQWSFSRSASGRHVYGDSFEAPNRSDTLPTTGPYRRINVANVHVIRGYDLLSPPPAITRTDTVAGRVNMHHDQCRSAGKSIRAFFLRAFWRPVPGILWVTRVENLFIDFFVTLFRRQSPNW